MFFQRRQTSTSSTTPVSPIYGLPSNLTSGSSIDHLPLELRNGLVAMGYFGLLSSISTLILLVFITWRMVFWRKFYDQPISKSQMFILIYNLLLADLQQSLSFLISFHWLTQDEIVPSKACFAQGWLIQVGDVSSGLWVLAIAIHTGINLAWGKSVTSICFVCGIVFIWAFTLILTILGPLLHGEKVFTPAGAWCWIGEEFQHERLYLHYLWIFIAQFGSIFIYAVVFIKLRRQLSIFRHFMPIHDPQFGNTHNPDFTFQPSTTVTIVMSNPLHDPFSASRQRVARAARYMVVYPFAYVALTLPLATARVSSMGGKDWGLNYYCITGALIASSGIVDVALYIYTRKGLIKSSVGLKSETSSRLTRGGSQRSELVREVTTRPLTLGDLMREDLMESKELEAANGIVVSRSIIQSEGSIAPSRDGIDDPDRISFDRPVSQQGLNE